MIGGLRPHYNPDWSAERSQYHDKSEERNVLWKLLFNFPEKKITIPKNSFWTWPAVEVQMFLVTVGDSHIQNELGGMERHERVYQ